MLELADNIQSFILVLIDKSEDVFGIIHFLILPFILDDCHHLFCLLVPTLTDLLSANLSDITSIPKGVMKLSGDIS